MSLRPLVLAIAIATLPITTAAQRPAPTPWWQNAVIYEIYPRSFQDSNGDGIGDINGITQRLDYLQHLGVDAIWLTPIYPSPQVDFGYDISDYTAIDPQYGTLADFDHLVAEAKKRNIRVIMDLVLNHTSDRHPWFIESAASRTNPKRDWYIWRDGKKNPDGTIGPPNNWPNRIEQSAWQLDAATGQFYYHYFAIEQPDLNWRNPAVEAAMFDAAKFWFNRGVSGFRLDAVNTLFEDEQLRDAPHLPSTNEYGEPSLSQVYQRNLAEVHNVLRDLRTVADTYPEPRLLIGEIYTKSTAEMATWYGPHDDELQLPMDTNVGFLNRLDAAGFRKLISEADSTSHTPLFVFDNHDRPRSWDRYGDGQHNLAIAKILAAILLTTPSSALVYQGQELGMETITPARKEDVRDPRGIVGWPKEKGRDGERTPMQWDASKDAGFSSAPLTWLPIEASYPTKNVAAESADPQSLLNWYQTLIQLKRTNPAIHSGATRFFNFDVQNALVWLRTQPGSPAALVACNLSANSITLNLSPNLKAAGIHSTSIKTLASDSKTTPTRQSLQLAPYQSVILEIGSK